MPPLDFVSRGQQLIAAANYQEAVKVCRLGLLGKPTQVDGRLILAQALLALRRYDEVLAEMRVALELDGGLSAAHALKGEALLRKGDLHAARETLMRARQLAPGDPGVAALVAETEVAIANGGHRPVVPGDVDPMTKHYPTHRGGSPAGGAPSSSSFTRPALPGPERTGTVELDPNESGVEMIEDDDELGDVIDPPTPLEELEPSVVEILDADVVSARDATVGGKKAVMRRTETGGPDIGAMFPDDEKSGLDSLLGELHGPPGASVAGKRGAALPLPAQPTGSVPVVGGRPPPRRGSDDMATIRAGLGLDPSRRLPQRAVDDTGLVVNPGTGPLPRRDDSSVVEERPAKAAQSTRKVATDPGRQRVVRPRGRGKLAAYVVLAVMVIGGGVWGGFQIRAMRLERQVAKAKRDADAQASADTWRGWLAARDVLEGVVAAQNVASNRAALARARATLAGEFGDDLEGAHAAVEALGTLAIRDADLARAELAIADGDTEALGAAAAALEKEAPDAADTAYVAGRLALAQERWDDAVAAFDRAREQGGARPLYLVSLARAHAGRSAWPEARAAAELALSQHPDHPAAVIEHARILAAAPFDAAAAGPAATALEKVLAEAERPVDQQLAGVSPTQAAWAAIALAELMVARGDPAAAKKAFERSRAHAPVDRDRDFAVAGIHVLLAVGDLAGAHAEAERAGKAFPTTPAVAIAVAEVALAEDQPARALEALEPAGDLSGRPQALALRGQAYLRTGDTERAAQDLDAALAKAPELEAALIARAELDLGAGNPRAAVTRLEKRYGEGGSTSLAVTYAAALRGVGERDRARVVLGTLTGGDAPRPIAGRAWLETARLERDGGDAAAARNAYAKAIEMLPDPSGARLEAALLLVDTGDVSGARESLDRLAADPKADGRVLVEAARVHVLGGDLDGAKTLLDRAETTTTAPRWQLARERGRLALRQRAFPVAIESLALAASLEPSDGDTHLLLIDAHLAKEDADSARKVLDFVLKRFAGEPEAQLATGRVRLYSDAIDEAREAFVKAKDQLERSHAAPRWIADATYWLARTTYYGGDPVRARALAAQAVALDPSLADCHMLLGEIDAERNQSKLAVRDFARVTALDPANADAWFFLGENAFKTKQKKTARTALAKYLELAPTGDLAADAKAMLAKL